MQAPEKIWATPDSGSDTYGTWDCAGFSLYGDRIEYHIARPNQPCSTDEFIIKMVEDRMDNIEAEKKYFMRMWHWASGDFEKAMEGLE